MTGRRDEVYVMGVVPASDGTAMVRRCGNRDEFIAALDGFHPDLQRVLEAATDVTYGRSTTAHVTTAGAWGVSC